MMAFWFNVTAMLIAAGIYLPVGFVLFVLFVTYGEDANPITVLLVLAVFWVLWVLLWPLTFLGLALAFTAWVGKRTPSPLAEGNEK